MDEIAETNVYNSAAKNKGFSKDGAINMRPGVFVTKQEKLDYEDLKKDLTTRDKDKNIISAKSVNNIIAHVIKNRTRFHAQISPKFLFNKWLQKYFVKCSKKNPKARATDRDEISEYKRQKLYKNGVNKYNSSMDLVGLLKVVRQTKIFFRT